MKKILFIVCTLFLGFTSDAQSGSGLAAVLENYIQIKEALVKSDALKAGSAAVNFENTVSSLNEKALSAEELKAFISTRQALSMAAKNLSNSRDLAKQREAFVSLSNSLIALARSVKLSGASIYVDYCPMKKAWWISKEPAVRNPYYGNSMLSCGSVKETLQ